MSPPRRLRCFRGHIRNEHNTYLLGRFRHCRPCAAERARARRLLVKPVAWTSKCAREDCSVTYATVNPKKKYHQPYCQRLQARRNYHRAHPQLVKRWRRRWMRRNPGIRQLLRDQAKKYRIRKAMEAYSP